MGTRSVRRGITQAAWNRGFTAWYLWHYFAIPGLLGVLFASWWVFLVSALLIQLLLNTPHLRSFVLGLYALPWGYLAYGMGIGWGATTGAWALALLGFCMAHMALSAGWQYYDDLA